MVIKIISTVLCGVLLSFSSRNILSDELEASALREDIAALRKALEKYHPGIYWYTSKEEFDLTWDSLNAKLDKTMTGDQFFKLLLPVVAKVKCAHTLFYPSDRIISNGSRFPLDLKFIGEKTYIMSDISIQNSIPKGSELLTINGRGIKNILSLLLPNIEAQGGNIGWKYVALENDFQNYYHYIIEHAETFQIEYVDRITGQKASSQVNGSSEEKFRRHWKNWYPEADGAPLKMIYCDDKRIAIITVKSFTTQRYEGYHQNFDKLIDQFFTEVRNNGVQNLIIDVRGNEGGNQPEKLYSYLVKETRNIAGDQNKYYDKIKQAKNNFGGDVIVLTNERSISAQETFVSIFKYHNRGFTIGRATAGCAKYLCGGKKHKLVLPNSKFQINIPMNPTIRIIPIDSNYKAGEGYPPDFQVEDDINSLLEGKDVMMEFAINKIKQQ